VVTAVIMAGNVTMADTKTTATRARATATVTSGALASAELRARARRVRLVLTDSDGVLTDGGVYYSDSGEALRRFSVRDGMGVERLRGAGIATGIITRELCGCVERRAAKLGLPHLFLGVRDKAAQLPAVLAETGLGIDALAYIGDDVNDLGIMAAIGERGLTAAPADAMPELLAACHYRCTAGGGHGAFRDFAEWILALRASREEAPVNPEMPAEGDGSGPEPAEPAAGQPKEDR
jgi:3-deoxy-D-manno-octulosonate 8-phosphate phosphatase (KDO 8-P phosphatase)